MTYTIPNETIAACTGISDKAGRVAAFTIGDCPLDDDQIARYSRHLKDKR